MASVWRAQPLPSGDLVAVKVIHAAWANHPEACARFFREAKVAATLDSPYLVKVLDFGQLPDGTAWMAMEMLQGEELKQRISRQGVLSLHETVHWIDHVCWAMQAAHDLGLVHRDLKPGNIVIDAGPQGEVAKVLDFGVAKVPDVLSDGSLDPTKTGSLLGTPYYMSPEQAQGLKTIDQRSDLWAIGVITFECLTGTRPFTASALGPLIAKILTSPIPKVMAHAPSGSLPAALEPWFHHALAREPAQRFSNARQMADALIAASR
jgi:serine/threonine-protein kinase